MGTLLRTLLVEDSEDDVALMLHALSRGGYEPVHERVETGDALAIALESRSWDIVLCDYALPHYSGDAALALITTQKPHLPVIIVTGAIGEETAVQLIKAGASDYVMKDRLYKLPMAVAKALQAAAELAARRQAEADFHNALAQLRGLLEAATDAVFEIDEAGTIKIANKAAHRLFGWPPEALYGRSITAILPPDQQEAERAGTKRFSEAEEARLVGKVTEVIGLKSDGTPVPCELSLAALDHHDGTRRLVGIVRDITERKTLEVQASRLEHMALLGQLMGGIAHEIKNPLFVLTGSMQLLKERLVNKEYNDLQHDLDRIENAAGHMTQTVQRFLAIARPAPSARERCSVAAILRQTLDFLQYEFLKNQVRVEVVVGQDLPSIESDPMLLQEVFLNLIMNAVQAMHEAHGRGTLTVSAKRSAVSPQPSASEGEGDWIEVRIQDDGPGILPEHRAKLFEPFFTTKPVGSGTGLGLWIVRTTLASLGGTVTCETEVGRGATFIVRLPVAGAATRRGHGDAGD